MPRARSPSNIKASGPVTDRLDDVLVMMPSDAFYPDDVLRKVEAFLLVRFPDLRCTLEPGRGKDDQGFMALPMDAARPGTQELALSFQALAKLGEIVDALEGFRASGWKRQMN